MKLPSQPLRDLGNLASSVMEGGFLGIDIGTSSMKVVELSLRGKDPTLETYGEIDLGPYADREIRKAVHLAPERLSAALMDLLHEVNATARRGGIGIPLPSALISYVRMPKRDPEQMRLIVPGEAKRYVPVPLESVMLDWMVLPEDERRDDALSQAQAGAPVQAQTQDVMLLAVEKSTTQNYDVILKNASIAGGFYEVEFFSAIRANARGITGAALLMDLGASATKLAVMSGRGVPVAVHLIPKGGQAITEAVMAACGWPFDKAEEAKRTAGLVGSSSFSESDIARISETIRGTLSEVFADAARFLAGAANERQIDIDSLIVTGGGACMPGILEAVQDHFKKTVKLAEPFGNAHAPMILSDVLREVGPKYAVAMGLAMRGIAG